jgi:hypothetical protein
MTLFRTKSFLTSLAFIGACSSVCVFAGCSDDDDDGGHDHDAGTGGSKATGGKSGTGGKSTGGGGASSGGASSGGGPGTGGANTGGSASGGDGGVVPDSGAGGSVPDGGGDSGEVAPDEAGVRIVHASPGAPSVDIYAKGSTAPLAKNVAYGEATGYVTVSPGTFQFEVRQAGTAATSTPAFTTPNVTIGGGKRYTAVAAGNLGSSEPADRFRVLALEEGFGDAEAGKTRVRIVHAAYDAPSVGVDIGNDDASAPEIATLARFADSGAEGAEVDSGEALQIGVIVNANPLTAFTTPKLPDKKNVFLIATGLTSKFARDPLGLQGLAVMSDSTTVFIKQNPRIYAVHASPDAGPVDVFSGNTEVIDNTSFGKLSLVQVPPGAVTLDFFAGVAGKSPRPAGDPAASGQTPALEAGNSYLAVAAGAVTAPSTFSLITVAEGFDAASATQARLRAVHASADGPAVDIGTVATTGILSTPVFTNAKYKDVTPVAGANVDVGSVTIGLAPTGTTTTSAEFDATLTASERGFVIVAGKYAGTNPNPLQLLVVNTTGVFWSISASPKK